MPPTNTNTNPNASLPTSNLFNSITSYTVVNDVATKIDELTSIPNSVEVNA